MRLQLMFWTLMLSSSFALCQGSSSSAGGYDVALLGSFASETNGSPANSSPSDIERLGDRVYFSAAGELWLTDGTPSSTRRLVDSCSGPCPNGAIFDRTPEGLLIRGIFDVGQVGYWRVSRDGQVQLFDAPEGLSLGSITVARIDRGLLAAGYSPAFGNGLYLFDEQDLTVRKVEDPDNPDTDFEGLVSAALVGAGGMAFFTADTGIDPEDPIPPAEPPSRFFATDGTPEGTVLLVDQQASSLLPVADSLGIGYLVTRSDGGMVLWSSDGSMAGSARLGRWSASVDPFVASPVAQTMALADGVALVAYDSEHGFEIWRAGRSVGSLQRLTDLEAPEPKLRLLGSVGDQLYFEATNEFGTPYIWGINLEGGPATRLSIGIAERAFTLTDHFVYVRADSSFSDSKAEVWTSDGTVEGTELLAQGCLAFTCSNNVAERLSSDGLLYFFVDYGLPLGTELWRTDGTKSGTAVVARLPMANRDQLHPPEVAALSESVVFAANDPVHGTEPWSVELGSPDDASLLADLRLSSPSLEHETFLVLESGAVLLLGCDGLLTRIWRTQGTPASTAPFGAQRQDFLYSCPNSSFVSQTTVGNRAYIGDLPAHILWTVDVDSTTIKKQFETDSGMLRSELSVIGDQLLFLTAPLGSSSTILRVVDSSSKVERIAELSGAVQGVGTDESRAYLLLSKPGPSLTIWSTDLTPEGTALLKELPSYQAKSSAIFLVDRFLFFYGSDGSAPGVFRLSLDDGNVQRVFFGARSLLPREGIVTFDGSMFLFERDSSFNFNLMGLSTAGTSEIPLYSSSLSFEPPSELVALSDGLYFFAPTDEGPSLWYSDGTAANTRALFSLPSQTVPISLAAYDDRLFFVARDPAHGTELWTSDGTSQGTRLLRDIYPGVGSSFPRGFAATPRGLFFSADDGLHGFEPWVITSGRACKEAENALCLSAERFRVAMTWRHPDGSLHIAGVRNLTADTGAFWFFNEDNLENIVKLLDGRSFNGAHWVFSGGLTNLEYQMTVTDTATGISRRYFNPPFNLASYGDTGAFHEDTSPESAAAEIDVTTLSGGSARNPLARLTHLDRAQANASCVPSSILLCLADGRFAVAVDWKTSGGASGVGTVRELTDDTGAFSFFNQKNLEIVLKVLDGTAINGRYWVFYASLSNVDFTVTVTDTETGKVKTYRNSSGSFASLADTTSF